MHDKTPTPRTISVMLIDGPLDGSRLDIPHDKKVVQMTHKNGQTVSYFIYAMPALGRYYFFGIFDDKDTLDDNELFNPPTQ